MDVGQGVVKRSGEQKDVAALRDWDRDLCELAVASRDGAALEVRRFRRTVELAGQPVALTYVEFELLRTLASEPARVFTREMLLRSLWGDSAYREQRTIDVHIRHLREKLERDAREPEYIFTVRGVGYRFRD